MTIEQIIKARHSVRSFDGCPVLADISASLKSVETQVCNPFKAPYQFVFHTFDAQAEAHPGTYGVIQNASTYILVGVQPDNPLSYMAAGYSLERMLLHAVGMGLGYCWMGGTFRGNDFVKAINFDTPLHLRLIIPIGYPADRIRLTERLAKALFRSNSRKPFDTLFSQNEFGEHIPASSPYSTALEMMRLAPSSLNSQPWRALVDGDKVHFYGRISNNLNYTDIGIAISHFTAVAPIGKLATSPDAPHSDKYTYITTYTPVSATLAQ